LTRMTLLQKKSKHKFENKKKTSNLFGAEALP